MIVRIIIGCLVLAVILKLIFKRLSFLILFFTTSVISFILFHYFLYSPTLKITNFPKFGFYNIVLNLNEVTTSENNMVLGDAIDDLSDIIYDLLEVKWRLENNSIDDGIWFFKFIFESHTKQHIIDLLNYLNQSDY